MAAVDERVADGADRMTLADAGQAEGQDIGGVVEEVAVGDLVETTDQRRRQAAFVERRERFPRRQFRGAPSPRDAALVPLLPFELEDLQQQRQGGLLLR